MLKFATDLMRGEQICGTTIFPNKQTSNSGIESGNSGETFFPLIGAAFFLASHPVSQVCRLIAIVPA